MNRSLLVLLVWASLLAFSATGRLLAEAPDGITYKSGPLSMMKLGRDIYGGLKPAIRDVINLQPISIEPDQMPYARLSVVEDDGKKLGAVSISAGFVDLVNRVAHAKAIDQKRKGYFLKYVLSLENESGEQEMKPLPDDTDPQWWNDRMLNEQLSNFNSIVGIVVGIKLAHHQLGHYQKYESQLVTADGKRVPINTLLTPKEWEDALKAGARIALEGGCTVEGVLPFFDAFEKMTHRPAWVASFVPATAKYKDIKKTLERVQREVFEGR